MATEHANVEIEELADALERAISYALSEIAALGTLQQFFSPKPADLATSDENREEFNEKLEKLIVRLGGPPTFIVVPDGCPTPVYDTWIDTAVREMTSVFRRARTAVMRAHTYFLAFELLKKPELLENPPSGDVEEAVKSSVLERFWDHTEIGLVRLVSYWDRVGQLFDAMFFNIRQYERDGFPSVMDRIHVNYARRFPKLRESREWIRLRAYQTSAQPDGFQWLSRRRNLLVHSLHLGEHVLEGIEDDGDSLYTSLFNHLEESVRKKLKPGSHSAELAQLHVHLAAAADLFPDVLTFITAHTEVIRSTMPHRAVYHL